MNGVHVMETRYNEFLRINISKNLDITEHLENVQKSIMESGITYKQIRDDIVPCMYT